MKESLLDKVFRDRTIGLLACAGLALVPWIAVLSAALPRAYAAQHWQVAWVGFDAVEALGLILTALLLHRGDHRAGLAAMATATLLLVDGWFDVTTAAGGDLPLSVFEALGLELPLAILCIAAAFRRTVALAVSHE